MSEPLVVGAGAHRVGTGNPELDEVLRGGFPVGSINVIMGHPGTGKTVLAEQMLFANAVGPRPGVYLTTLSEPFAKVVSHLQTFTFYDEERMLSSVVYEDVGSGILEGGPAFVLERVGQLIRERQPRILVIDSFKALHDLAESQQSMRRMVSELAGLLSAYSVTTFLVGEYSEAELVEYPEFAVADGIIQLVRHPSGRRDERYLRVLKLRGSAYREGLHAFRIGAAGIRAFPRSVTPRVPTEYIAMDTRVSTGVAGLDRMLGGGLWAGSATLVTGSVGSGKTTLALTFAMAGLRQGEPSLFVNFQENPTQLARAIAALGLDPSELEGRGLHLLYSSPVEMQIDAIMVEIYRHVRAGLIRRVAIDGLGDLALAASDRERFHDYVYTLVQHLAAARITSAMTLEVGSGLPSNTARDAERFSSLSDAIIALEIDWRREPPRRTLRIVKARGMPHPLAAVPIQIERTGIRVLEEEVSNG